MCYSIGRLVIAVQPLWSYLCLQERRSFSQWFFNSGDWRSVLCFALCVWIRRCKPWLQSTGFRHLARLQVHPNGDLPLARIPTLSVVECQRAGASIENYYPKIPYSRVESETAILLCKWNDRCRQRIRDGPSRLNASSPRAFLYYPYRFVVCSFVVPLL